MNSNRAPGATGSSRGAAPSTPTSSSAARSPSTSRRSPTPTRDAGRGAASPYLASISGRSAGHGSNSTRLCQAAAAAAAAVETDGSPELVAQLQERLQQLESEFKTSQEAAQWTIKHNKNTLVSLKHENKELSAEVARRGGSAELQCKQGTATDGERVVERLERQVHELRRAYDKVVKDKKTALQKLDNLHDSLRDMAKVAAAAPAAAAAAAAAAAVPSHPLSASLSSAASVYAVAAAAATAAPAAPADSATARELRQLQNRLDKATAKANEAFSIRKTYEKVLEKLRKEEPVLESRIRALEEQKAMKETALQAAVLAGREVAAAKEAAKTTLMAMEVDVEANRARRARVLAEMREKASTLQQTNRALMQRQFMPLTPATPSQPASEAGDTPHEGDANGDTLRHIGTPRPAAPHTSSPPAVAPATPAADGLDSNPSTAPDEQDDITARDLVIRLCRVTNVQRVSELLARLLAQQESYARLVDMRAQATAQRLALTQGLEVLRTHRDELRRGGKLSTQKQMDAAQQELADATARCDAAQEVLESLLRGHADVRAGLEHLAALVGPLPLPPGGQPVVPVEDETLGDVLAQIELRLTGAFKLISALPKALEALESQYAALRQAT